MKIILEKRYCPRDLLYTAYKQFMGQLISMYEQKRKEMKTLEQISRIILQEPFNISKTKSIRQ